MSLCYPQNCKQISNWSSIVIHNWSKYSYKTSESVATLLLLNWAEDAILPVRILLILRRCNRSHVEIVIFTLRQLSTSDYYMYLTIFSDTMLHWSLTS